MNVEQMLSYVEIKGSGNFVKHMGCLRSSLSVFQLENDEYMVTFMNTGEDYTYTRQELIELFQQSDFTVE